MNINKYECLCSYSITETNYKKTVGHCVFYRLNLFYHHFQIMKYAKEILKNYSHLQYLGHADFRLFPVKTFSAAKSNWTILHEEVGFMLLVLVVFV